MASHYAFTALYDANVLYPAPLRDLLMRLAMTGLFRAQWSNDIHDEWMRNLIANRPDITQAQVDRIRDLMDSHIRDALIDGYQSLIPAIVGLPDPNDRHVVAAAIVGRADVIVTFNIRDFPVEILKPYRIQAQHPDDFIRHLIDLNRAAVCAAIQKQRQALKNPPISADSLLNTLSNLGLPQSTAALRSLASLL